MNNIETTKYIPTHPIPPGETIQDVLDERGISQAELAQRLNRPLKTVNEIIKGKASITPETALQLEQVLGIPAHFWINLESQYREVMLRIELRKRQQTLVTQSKVYPYHEMSSFGWIKDTRDGVSRVGYLLSYFGVTSFDNIIEEAKLKGAFRISAKHKYSMPAIASWLRKGSIDGGQIETTDIYSETKVKELLTRLRQMTFITEPNKLMAELKEEFRKCGIAFVVTRSLKNAPIGGSTRWLGSDKALIQMSLRWRWADIFWFSLFHEIGHILLDGRKEFNVDLISKKVDDAKEREKDEFAKNQLIPPDRYKEFVEKVKTQGSVGNIYSLIEAFSQQIGIHPGIVVGRLQHDGLMPNNMNRFRLRFIWS